MGQAAVWRGIGLAALLALAGCTGGGPKSALAMASDLDFDFIAAAVTWDLDRDGNVTCEEWKRYVAGLFAEADANHDGMLTAAEFKAMSRQDRLFETAGLRYFDANGDGQLTLAEITGKPNPAFTLLDTDNDCVLTPEERSQSGAGRRGRGSSGGWGGGGPGKSGGPRSPGM